jgi:shikimate dehydrogenase
MGVPYAEVIGDPIAHSKSPLIHKFWLGKLGLDYEYRSRRVTRRELESYFERRRHDPLWCGANVTIPHKQAALALVDEAIHPARAIGAVNAVIRTGRDPKLVGYNTDAPGFLDTLSGWPGLSASFQMADVIGTGGAAAAVAWALRDRGFLIMSFSRSDLRAEAFLRRLGEYDRDFVQRLEGLAYDTPERIAEDPDSGRLLINASPLGMRGFPPLEVSLKNWPLNILIYDLVYDPVETPLLRAARERGHPVISGIDMLIAQAARAFHLFFAEHAPRQHDDELRELLIS